MTPTTIFVWAALVPGSLMALAALLATRATRPALGGALVAIGASAAYVAAQLGLLGWQGFDGDVTQWLLGIAVLAGLAGLLETHLEHAGQRWVLRGALSLLAAWMLLRPLLSPALGGAGVVGSSLSAWWLLAVALAACCVWGALDRLARHDRGRLLPLLLALLATAGGATVFFAGSATTGALAGPIVALLGGLFAVALWRPQRGLLRPVIPSVALLLVGQWTVGRFYTNDMALVSLTLLIGSPLLLALALPWIGRTRQALAAALQIALLALTTSVATGVAAFSYFTPVAAPQASGAAKRGASATSQPRNDDDYGY